VNYQLKIIFKFGSDAAGISVEEAGKKNS
jgi:hypothetical protein